MNAPNPVTVGVTGHRDLREDDLPALAQQVTQALMDLAKQHPGQSLAIWTGLAEGADRLAARCAWQAGWQVGAVLALPVDEFERDFEGPASLQDFRALLQRCTHVHVVAPPGTPRPDCYAAVGEWLCQESVALLALWDGDGAAAVRPGGTAWVVQRFHQVHGVLPADPASASGALEQGRGRRLVHIPVRRALQLTTQAPAN